MVSLLVVIAVAGVGPALALNSGGDLLVAAAARGAGAAGSMWSTDLYVFNPGEESVRGTLYWLVRNQSNASPIGESFTLFPGETLVLEDVIQQTFGLESGSGAFWVVADGDVVVNSRIYNRKGAVTFGQGFPGIPRVAAVAAGEVTDVVGLAESSSFRTNLVLVDASGGGATVSLSLRTPGGTELASGVYTLGAFEPRLFPVTNLGASLTFDAATLHVEVTSGAVIVAASKVDNDPATGDPTTLEAWRALAAPEGLPVSAPALTATAASASQVNLSWTAVTGATGYRLYRGGSQVYAGTARTYSDTGLSARTQYCYTVRAYNAAGDGPLSSQACATTQGGGGGQEITVTLPGGVPLVLVKIPRGTFTMGSPEGERGRLEDREDLHQVTLTQDYNLGKYEVTQRQWVAVMGSNPSHFTACGLDCPVEKVSWNDICGGATGSTCTATSFIGRVNAHLGTTAFRLPTEAEWERAARGETTTEFSFPAPAGWDLECGSFPEALPYMWWCNNAGSMTHPVGTKQANPYGLHDMHGNVDELVGDWFTSNLGTAVATDPTGPSSGSWRVKRGGAWSSGAQVCRSAIRSLNPPSSSSFFVGFRLARSQ